MKTVELNTECLHFSQHDYLFENIAEEACNIFTEEYSMDYKSLPDFKLRGDVSYSQGRGVGFDGLNLDTEQLEKLLSLKFIGDITASSYTKFDGDWWNKKVDIEFEIDDDVDTACVAKDIDGTVLCDDDVVERFESKVKEIEKQLLKYGEDEVEYKETETINQDGLIRFFEENNIETNDCYIYDMNYTNDGPKDGYTHITTDGDVNLKGLRIELGELEKHTRTIETKEDGKVVSKKEENFYTFKQ